MKLEIRKIFHGCSPFTDILSWIFVCLVDMMYKNPSRQVAPSRAKSQAGLI
jgi:hypothetical protein